MHEMREIIKMTVKFNQSALENFGTFGSSYIVT